jgi:hypothetical protein
MSAHLETASGAEALNGAKPSASLNNGFDPVHYQPIFRSPGDIQLLRQKDRLILFLSLVIVGQTILAFYLFLRKPDLVVAVTTPDGQRVVTLNNREPGATESVRVGKDQLTNDDKTYRVNQCTELRYAVDPATRGADIEQWLRCFVPQAAVFYAKQLKDEGVLEQERAEQWQSVWKPQSIKVDAVDPYLIRVIGTQEITKIINGAEQKDQVQLELTYKLTSNGKRSDENMRTGFQIVRFDRQVISQTSN